MRFIKWDPLFSSNVDEIDEQHKNLIEMINRLYEAAQRRDRSMINGDFIAQLKKRFDENFATEERFMLRHNYPDIARHRVEHRDLVKNVLDFQAACCDNAATVETIDFHKEWIVRHVLSADRKLGAFLTERKPGRSGAGGKTGRSLDDWFRIPEEKVYFHQGHSWAMPEDGDVVRVGIDAFAHGLLGRIDAVKLPPPGSRVAQGETGWSLLVGAKSIDMLSPVDGEVLEINEQGWRAAGEAGADPYGRSWLLKVRAPKVSANLKNLLSGGLARKWMGGVREDLFTRMGYELGTVCQDGGVPVDGIARHLDRERWDAIVREFFLV